MKNLVLVFVVAFAFSSMAMASDIAFYVGPPNPDWYTATQQVADVATIIDATGHLFADIQQFDDNQFDEFSAWIEANTDDGEMDIIWLNGTMPSVLYPFPNLEPDGSRAEEWLDNGNMIINVGDWFGYMSYEGGSRSADNAGTGAANILDLSSGIIVDAGGTTLPVTATGQEYLPSLNLNDPAPTDRPVILAEVQAPWEVAAVFAGNATQADPVVIHNTVTDGYVAFINQAFIATSIDDRGVTSAEFILNWVNSVIGLGTPVTASDPNPEDKANDVPRDLVLSWTPGETAHTHDVYLGAVFDDVNDANRDNPLDVLLSQGQDANTYEPGRLELGRMYYWRVDEVNASPDNTIFTGDIWNFTAEPLAYPIENITVTASSSEERKEPENTVNGSGLDETGLLHNNIGSGNMWLSGRDGNQPSFIEYEFGKVYKLHEMWVWNSNESLEHVLGLGFRDVTIEYSVNGTDFTTLGTTHEFARGSGVFDYAHNTTIDFGNVSAKYVRLTANSNWGGLLNQYGLSEVRFFQMPVHAKEPSPDIGATDVALVVILGWRAGREAAVHNIYFSDDELAVIDGTADVTTVTDTSYGPLSLDLGKTYYWRVDEVNNAETPDIWQGEVWEFTTHEYFVVDDFEDYNDYEPDRIFDTWIDGWGIDENGATIGYESPSFPDGEHFVETAIVNSGSQSMPYFFDNTTAGNSEATMTLSTRRNWTEKGVGSLTLWFRGNPASEGSFTEAPASTYTMTASGVDIWDQADEFHYAYRTLSSSGSIIARVESIDNTDPWAKAGVMIRESLEPGSKHAFACITPENGVASQGRTIANSDSFGTEQTGITAPHWVKLERGMTGVFTVSHSTDGVNWVPVEGATNQYIQMGTEVYIGLALTSHNPDAVCTAVFSNVQFEGTVGPTWTNQDIGILSNPAEKMYVVLDGSAAVYHNNPDASQIDEWTEWNIDLQEFADQGVDLTDVDTLGIGFGDRENPQPGGSGVVYFDDIRLYPPPPEPEPEPVP